MARSMGPWDFPFNKKEEELFIYFESDGKLDSHMAIFLFAR